MKPSTPSRSRSRPAVTRLAAVAWLASCTAAAAIGPNLLVNPSFDHDTVGWSGGWEFPNSPAPIFDPTRDVEGSPTSGSALVPASVGGGPVACQCVNVRPQSNVSYRFGGWVLMQRTYPNNGASFTLDAFDQPNCTGNFSLDSFGTVTYIGGDGWSDLEGEIRADGQKSLRFCGVSSASVSPVPINFDDLFVSVASSGDCVGAELSDTLCLDQRRYSVQATYSTSYGVSGSAQVAQLSPAWGYLWFFVSDSIEVTVKVIDACALNGHHWVFASGLTNVGVVMTVTDTQTGTKRTYTNELGQPFPNIQDTSAFATCP